MIAELRSVYISLGAVVLDRPDQSGEFIAKDFASGWAYIIADHEGDKRFRGQGSCAGGLATGLRYAFMSAVGCVPNCGRITIYVESPHAHQQMVQLATADARVVAAIASRPVFVMTRPQERTSHQVRLAAERAAMTALRTREHIERQETSKSVADPVAAETEADVEDSASIPEPRQSWRQQWSGRSADVQPAIRATARSASRQAAAHAPKHLPLASAGVAPMSRQSTPARTRALMQWLQDFDTQVESVQTGLHNAGW